MVWNTVDWILNADKQFYAKITFLISLKKFESLTQSEKIASLQFHLLKIGTLTKKLLVRNISIVCRHFPIETEQTEPSVRTD